MKRSNEPIFWSLFGAGGLVVAFILPMLIFITGIAVPLGILPREVLEFERIQDFANHWPGKLFIFAVISLTLWHSAHRIFLSLHDLGIHWGRGFFRWLL
ncbi:MAG: fumarate reductase [Gammaproteobacteria bacterium RIFCSPLOWO2_02_FULL_56_15]|nr:MAG: fumarate reductase [Gammaproteobacteria bacterium RIFCSPLOWO2_02_FULL_56_15]